MQQDNAVDKFFKDLPSEDKQERDIFNEKKPESEVPAKGEEDGKKDDLGEDDPRKNRRHRRLEEQLQRERESNIALNERLKAATEADRIARDSGGKLDPRLIKLFGSDEKGQEVTAIMTDILRDNAERAKAEALAEIEERNMQSVKAQKEFESYIDTELEHLEDTHNVDLTSDAPAARKARREFLEMVQNLSPKDQEGTITGYADFDSAFELYKKTKQEQKSSPAVDRAKEIASRSMQRPGGGSESTSTQKTTPGFRGWMKDFNIN